MAQTSSTPAARLSTRFRATRNSSYASSDDIFPATEPPLKKRKYTLVGAGLASEGHLKTSGQRTRLEEVDRIKSSTAPEPTPGVPQTLITNGVPTSERPRRESRRERVPARPRFSSAAAAAAAVAHGDGFKPREERGWEEFHQDLDIDAVFSVFKSDEVDGTSRSPNGSQDLRSGSQQPIDYKVDGDETLVNGTSMHPPITSSESFMPAEPMSTPKRRPGRPPRRPDAMLKGIGISPDTPRIIPPPGFNPREKLTLPKPSFRQLEPFARFQDREEFVDQTMSNVGYQESELWPRPESLIRVTEGNIEDDLLIKTKQNEKDDGTGIGSQGVGRVEYDMDEQDAYWLGTINETRKDEEIPEIKPWVFEVAMTKIEKEWHALEKRIPKPNPKPPQTHRPRSSSAAAVNGELAPHGEEQDTKCAICDDGDCENTNAIVFCDGCDLAVHQECYGVPFIPEGQWLCRKCQLIGRGTPTCIFCPNTDGAFKQTNASRWSHLLCAIWIPEVSIGNTTFMEPVMDVEKVPKPRWKLTCYICRQKMGACVQCGNKNCYIAFHVTCARRARLFLRMKSSHGGPANLDASILKAFCDKHVPADWRREHDVDRAIVEALDHYRYTMRGRLWADSQQAALTAVPPPTLDPVINPGSGEETTTPRLVLKLSTKASNRPQPPKIVWKLPSGAPVVPRVLFESIENSLARFTIRKRKDFAAQMCRYWTLKREARRGAALLKRLQLQMETFTSMEIPRRNFAGMGAAGGVRLQRRIDFADTLLADVEALRNLCSSIVQREHQKLSDTRMLQDIVDTMYFPLGALLSPIYQKAIMLDNVKLFENGLPGLRQKLDMRLYERVLDFAQDLAAGIAYGLVKPLREHETGAMIESNGPSPARSKPPSEKARKTCAKRIVRAIQGSLEDAIRKQAELLKSDKADDEIQQLATIMDDALLARHDSLAAEAVTDVLQEHYYAVGNLNGSPVARDQGSSTANVLINSTSGFISSLIASGTRRKGNGVIDEDNLVNGNQESSTGEEPLQVDGDTLLNGEAQATAPASFRGVPFYMESFQPQGILLEAGQWGIRGSDTIEQRGKTIDEAGSSSRNSEGQVKVNGTGALEVVNNVVDWKKKKAAARKRKRGRF